MMMKVLNELTLMWCKILIAMTHPPETGTIIQLHFLAPFLAPVFIPYMSGMKISGAENNVAESDVDDKFAETASTIAGIVAKGKLKKDKL